MIVPLPRKHPLLLAGILAALSWPTTRLTAQSAFIVTPGTNVNVSGTMVLDNTDLINNGSFDAAAANVILTGNGNNNINGSTAPVIGTLRVNKTGASNITLNNNVQVNTLLDFQGGIIGLNGRTINLNSPAMLQAEDEADHITGVAGGTVTTTVSGVNNPVQLNIGNLGAEITSGANLGNVMVSRRHQPTGTPENMSIQRIFQITPTNNAALNATLRFHYLDAELGGADENTLTLWRSTDNIEWTPEGADSRNTTTNYVEKAGIASFSYWTLADASNPLSLALVSFKATCQNDGALIEWHTSEADNIDRFEIEKSTDGNKWATLGSVKAHSDSKGSSYAYEDKQPSPEAWYKLKIVDRSKNTSYSPIFSGGCSDIGKPFMVYPNPAYNETTVSISVRQEGSSVVQVFDAAGAHVYTGNWELQPGSNKYTLPTAALSAGVYSVKLLFNTQVFEAQLIKL